MHSPFKIVILIVWCLFGMLSGAHGAPPPLRYDPTPAPVTMRDGTGKLWGHYNSSGKIGLFYQVGNTWQREAFPATEGADTLWLGKRPNGKIVGLWSGRSLAGKDDPRIGPPASKPEGNQVSNQEAIGYRLSEHYGSTSRLLGAFQIQSYHSLSFFVDDVNAWIILDSREIYRIGLDGAIEHAYSVTPDQEQRLYEAIWHREDHNALSAIVDGQGHVWFWSNMWDEGANAYLLRGFLLWDGHHITRHAMLPGWPKQKPFAVNIIAPQDATRVWMGVDERGLYSVDCATLQAHPVSEPAPKAFHCLQYITPRGKDWYVVAGSRWGNEADDAALNTGQLWRLRGGKWQLLIDGLDADTGWSWSLNRPLLETPAGLWVAGSGVGLWFVPHEQLVQPPGAVAHRVTPAAVPIDWRRGFVLPSVTELDTEPDGSIVAIGYPGREIITDPQALLALRPAPRTRMLQTKVGIIQDKQRHLWTMLSLPARAVNEWDGERWLAHALPKTYKAENTSELAFDKLGRLWLLPDTGLGQTAIFDPAKPAAGAWQLFPGYNQALLAQRRLVNGHYVILAPPQFARVRSDDQIYPYLAPDYSQDGRICYRSRPRQQVRYYDGKVWHRWSAREIAGASKEQTFDNSLDDAPFFNLAGVLCVHVDGDTWQWHSGAGWKKKENESESDPRPAANVPNPTSVDLPRALTQQTMSEASSHLGDKTGTVWLLWRKQLYKIRGNLYAPQFAPADNHPFLTAGGLAQVFVDGRGNRFFKTGDDPYNYVMLAHSTSPATRVQVKTNAIDSFTLNFFSPSPGPKWYQWRLDKGRWDPPQTAATVRLDELPGGQHQVEVVALDRNLEPSPIPTVATLWVPIDPAQQVTQYIKNLAAADYNRREAAVRGLSRQPTRALPALRAVRAKASDDKRWWLDAAIQQCEENLSKGLK